MGIRNAMDWVASKAFSILLLRKVRPIASIPIVRTFVNHFVTAVQALGLRTGFH